MPDVHAGGVLLGRLRVCGFSRVRRKRGVRRRVRYRRELCGAVPALRSRGDGRFGACPRHVSLLAMCGVVQDPVWRASRTRRVAGRGRAVHRGQRVLGGASMRHSLACETLYRCEVACPTLDCATACEFDDAGTALFEAYGALLLGDCTVACGLGQNWSCVGHVSWPQPKATTLSVSAVVANLIGSDPTTDAGVKLCAASDRPFRPLSR